jgi:hypothetical protein
MPDSDPSSILAEIRDRRDGADADGLWRPTIAALDLGHDDIPHLVAAVEAALKLADQWKQFAAAGDAQDQCAGELREAITAALTGQEAGGD